MTVNTSAKHRILIIEDEYMIATSLKDVLIEAGFEIAGMAGTLPKALSLIELGVCDAAIVDANLDGESAAPAGMALATRGLPFLVLSGYSPEQQQKAFPDSALFIQKPYKSAQLVGSIIKILRNQESNTRSADAR
jgi:DNA-binding response OmpR family regulator